MIAKEVQRMYWLLLSGREDSWPRGAIPMMGLPRRCIPNKLWGHIKIADTQTLLKYYMDRLEAAHPECFEDEED